MQKVSVQNVDYAHKKPSIKSQRKSPPLDRKPRDRSGTFTKDESSSAKSKSVHGNVNSTPKKNVAWKICHSKPSSKKRVCHYFPLTSNNIFENTPVLEICIMEAFMNLNQTIRAKIFANTSSQNTRWQQAKWYHAKGPLFSALNLFRAWMKAGKCPLWCKNNCVNLGAMHSVLEQCQCQLASIRSMFSESKLPSTIDALSFHSDELEVDEKMFSMLIEAFGTNLHIFSGISEIGHFSVKDGKWFNINKGFEFNCLGQIPLYAIPIKSPKRNIVGIVWIDSESKASAVLDKQFKCTLSEIKSHAMLNTTKIENIGRETKRRLLCELRQLISTPGVFFTTNPHQSGISIHTSQDHIPEVVHKIAQNIVNEIKLKFSNLEIEIHRQKSKNDVFMIVKSGLECGNISSNITRPMLKSVGGKMPNDQQGSRLRHFWPNLRCFSGAAAVFTTFYLTKTQFLRTNAEKYAVFQNPSANTDQTGANCQKDVALISSYSDEKEECCFISCPDTKQAEKFKKNHFQPLYKAAELKHFGQMSQNDVAFVQVVSAKIQVRQPRSHTTPEQNISALYALINKFLGPRFASQVNIDVVEYRAKDELLTLTLETTRLCQKSFQLFNFLSSKSINEKSITFCDKAELDKQLCHLEVIIPSDVYAVVGAALKRSLSALDPSKPSNWFKIVKRSDGMTCVFFQTSSRSVMQQALQMINDYLKPEIVNFSHMRDLDSVFIQSSEGQVFLERIMALNGIYITYDIRENCFQIFGVPYQRTALKFMLQDCEMSSLQSCTIGDSNHGIGLDVFLEEIAPRYDPQAKALKGIDAVTEILLIGSKIFYSTKDISKSSLADIIGLKQSLDTGRERVSSTVSERVVEEWSECVSCLTSVPKPYVYTIEGCGHSYCASCVELQTKTTLSNIVFPMLCAGCNAPFTLFDVSNFMKIVREDDAQMLLKRSALQKVRQTPELFLECPSGLCDGIVFLENQEEGQQLCCSKCKVPICLECKTVMHTGLSCKDNQDLFRSWNSGDPANRKMCPKCKMGIEKLGGCDNVTCRTCRTHICWKCLECFEVEDQCYRHLRNVHGGYH